jgi:hypothetical protein
MAEQKSDIVKVLIDLKKGILQLEGPQEFVEKYLDPIIKSRKPFSKAFPKPEPTVEERDKTRQLEKQNIISYFSLSLGLFATATLAYNKSNVMGWRTLVVVGGLSLLFCLYIAFFNKWKKQEVLSFAAMVGIDYMRLYLGLVSLGVGLISTRLNWASILGQISIYSGYLILIFGAIRNFIVGINMMKPKKPLITDYKEGGL